MQKDKADYLLKSTTNLRVCQVKNRANLGQNYYLRGVLFSRQAKVVSQDHAQHLSFLFGGGAMGRTRTKATVEMLNHNGCHKRGEIPIYPENRTCKDCGRGLSVYNGMDICNSCWTKNNFPFEDTEQRFNVECAWLREAGVR